MELVNTRPGSFNSSLYKCYPHFSFRSKKIQKHFFPCNSKLQLMSTIVLFCLRVRYLGVKRTGWGSRESRECTPDGEKGLPNREPDP